MEHENSPFQWKSLEQQQQQTWWGPSAAAQEEENDASWPNIDFVRDEGYLNH